jgi:hypothetical protein
MQTITIWQLFHTHFQVSSSNNFKKEVTFFVPVVAFFAPAAMTLREWDPRVVTELIGME